MMTTSVTASDRDLRTLAGIVSEHRDDLPPDGLPESLLADLMGQIRCDQLVLIGFDSGRQESWFVQEDPFKVPFRDTPGWEDLDRIYWQHYWDSRFCSYPGRTGDLRSITTITDFYSARQRHSTGMYTDYERPLGLEHHLMLCLPEAPLRPAGPAQHVRLCLSRGPGPDFSERDRALLTLLRPHLHQAFLDAERRRHPVPELTPRHWDLLRLVAAGHTNTQIARRLGISEGTVRIHLQNIYEKLHVSSRTAAVTRAFPEGLGIQEPTLRQQAWHRKPSKPGSPRDGQQRRPRDAGAQNVQIRAANTLIRLQPTAAPNGGSRVHCTREA